MTMGNRYRTETGQVHHYPHQQSTRRNRKCRLPLFRELELVPHLALQGPSLNPRYPRVSASRRSHLSSNPKRLGPLRGHGLPLPAPLPQQLPAFSGMEGRTARVAAGTKRGYLPTFQPHQGRYLQSRDDLKQTISSMSRVTKRVPRRTRVANEITVVVSRGV